MSAFIGSGTDQGARAPPQESKHTGMSVKYLLQPDNREAFEIFNIQVGITKETSCGNSKIGEFVAYM